MLANSSPRVPPDLRVALAVAHEQAAQAFVAVAESHEAIARFMHDHHCASAALGHDRAARSARDDAQREFAMAAIELADED
jgi:hypothetical protein